MFEQDYKQVYRKSDGLEDGVLTKLYKQISLDLDNYKFGDLTLKEWALKITSGEYQPVKYGRWIKQNPLADTEECSICGYNIQSIELETPYCAWCGAKMEVTFNEENSDSI